MIYTCSMRKVIYSRCVELSISLKISVRLVMEKSMLTMELSSSDLEIPKDAYTTLSQNLIGCSKLSQEYCELIWWYCKIMRGQLWILDKSILFSACTVLIYVTLSENVKKSTLCSLTIVARWYVFYETNEWILNMCKFVSTRHVIVRIKEIYSVQQ